MKKLFAHAAGTRASATRSHVSKIARRSSYPRIVSLAPNATSILVALDARKALVGVSRWCKDVADVGSLPQLGDCWALSDSGRAGNVAAKAHRRDADDVQTISRLRPDYILGSVPLRTEVVGKLLTLPATFIALNPRSLQNIFRDVEFLGRLVNRVKESAALIHQMEKTFAEIEQRASRKKLKPRVYCEAWSNPRTSSPPWVGELVRIAGGRLAVPCGQRVSDGQVARAKPDVIVLAWTATGDRANPQSALANNAWRRVPAVKNRQVVVIRDELLNTPGPPLLQGAEALYRALHGA